MGQKSTIPAEESLSTISKKEIEEAFRFLRTRGMRKHDISREMDTVLCFPLYVPTGDIDPVLEMLLTGKWKEFQANLDWLDYYEDEKKQPDKDSEEFVPIKGFKKRYSVSFNGRIKNIQTGRILKTRISSAGYEKVNLFNGIRQKTFFVHRLVIASFRGSKDLNVKHFDENKLNNFLGNLKYDCQKKFIQPEAGVSHKTVVNKVTGEEYESIIDAAEAINVNYGNLSSMLSGKIKNTTDLCLKK